MNTTDFYKVEDIAKWQLEPDGASVDLPKLQRGFVWKSHKIELLWDSLLRGYPIGSFLFSKDKDDKLFIMDGQQRATAIALGYYNPWRNSNTDSKFWSLRGKKIPVLWIDLLPNKKERTRTQKYVLRLVTQSHPWGYKCVDNSSVLTISERRKALEIFRENPANNQEGYTEFSLKNVFPYEANLPVPLSFFIESTRNTDWEKSLITLCENNLPIDYIETKYIVEGSEKETYIEKIKALANNDGFNTSIIQAIKNVSEMEIPAIIADKDILNDEDEREGDNPTLFVRLNSAGIQLSNEELIYSIYKAAFPETKELVESIGIGFIAPSRIISLVSRLIQSDNNNGDYPNSIGVTEFRNRIRTKKFTDKLKKLIGGNENKPAALLFENAIKILQLYDDINVPDVLVKNLITSTPDLFLMLLQWLYKNNNPSLSNEEKRKIFGAFSALCWFGRDNNRFVKEIWENLKEREIWNKRTLRKPFYHNNEFIMYPLVQPELLREFLLEWVVLKEKTWYELYTMNEDSLSEQYKQMLEKKFENEETHKEKIDAIWRIFIEKLIKNKSMLLFVQRDYINKKFKDFNQIESLEDTNTPWDWDHIYPHKHFSGVWYVNENIKHWSGTIGNFRVLALEDNRSLGDKSPEEKLTPTEDEATEKGLSIEELQKQKLDESFIKNDWEYWENISERIYDNNKKGIKNHLRAVINRLCNIYAEWYNTVYIGDLFNFTKN